MAYYLSPENRKMVLKLLKLFQNPEQGEVEVPVNNTHGLVYILRNAANTDFPELKTWKFKQKLGYVLCIPHVIVGDRPVERNNIELDYLGLISYITEAKPSDLIFTNIHITEREFSKLVAYGLRTNYTILKLEDNTIHITKNGIQRSNEDNQENRGTEG